VSRSAASTPPAGLGKWPSTRCFERRTRGRQSSTRPPTVRVDKNINPVYLRVVRFGDILRQLRSERGQGIKSLAPELGVNYSYLSKLENHAIMPSPELVERVAKYFNYDRDQLLLSAGKVPEEILDILRENPEEALEYLRERFGAKGVGEDSPA